MEVNAVLPYVFTGVGAGVAVAGYMRNRDKDNRQQANADGEERGFFRSKLESIEQSISTVGKDLNSLKIEFSSKIESTSKELIEIRERVVKVESKASSAHKRIDDMQIERGEHKI